MFSPMWGANPKPKLRLKKQNLITNLLTLLRKFGLVARVLYERRIFTGQSWQFPKQRKSRL
jgi:hypothetical protein